MIVPDHIVKKIERYFYEYENLTKLIDTEQEDIIFGSRCGEQDGSRSNAISKSTEKRALKLIDHADKNKEQLNWIEVVSHTIDHFKNTEYEKFIEMNYIKQYRKIKIMKALAIENTTFYNRRSDVITYAYCRAIAKDMVKVG